MDELAVFEFIESSGILVIPLFLFQGWLLSYFCGNFAESRLPVAKKWNTASVTALYLLLRYIGWKWEPGDWTTLMLVHLVWIFVITTILILAFFKAFSGIAAFLVVTFVAIGECSWMISYTCMQLEMKLLNLWVWFVDQEYFLLEEFLTAVEVTGILGIALYSVLTGILMYVFLKKVMKNFREKDCEIHKTELMFLLTPGITGLLTCLLLRTIMITVESTMPKLLFDTYPLLIPVVPAIMLLCMLSVCYGVKLFQDMTLLNRERNSRVILEKQIKSMQEHMTETERLYSGIRNIKHDMKNTLSIVMRLSAGNEGEESGELEAYLEGLKSALDKLDFHYRTGNAVVDALLNMKYYEIQCEMPELKLDAEQLVFPAGLVIQGYDYGVILGNALDNAIEACKRLSAQGLKEKLFIRLSSFQKGNQFFMEVTNSFDGKILLKKDKEFPETHKEDKKLHGMGLYHIKSTVEKYYGAVEWSAADKVFTLTVMMQNERRNENEL